MYTQILAILLCSWKFTQILAILLCSWKFETLFLKLEDQTLQTMQFCSFNLLLLLEQEKGYALPELILFNFLPLYSLL